MLDSAHTGSTVSPTDRLLPSDTLNSFVRGDTDLVKVSQSTWVNVILMYKILDRREMFCEYGRVAGAIAFCCLTELLRYAQSIFISLKESFTPAQTGAIVLESKNDAALTGHALH